jgi:two-component system phosphate regulon response regulator PhoB
MNELPSVNTREASIDRPPRVLVVEDEAPLGELLTYNLKAEGFEVEHVDRGDEAELRLAETPFDLVILDWMLPGVSGLEICRRMRTRDNIRDMPIIMLTARCEENERLRGLSVGADDYVVKPFTPCCAARPERVATKLTVGDIDLDRVNRQVRRAGREIHLGPKEFRMLEYLMEKPGRVFSRAQLLDSILGTSAEIDDRTVDVGVGRLRKALMRGRKKDPIRTVRGAGYSFNEKLGVDE